jgi:F-type H+-transporting ATPase subunit delta
MARQDAVATVYAQALAEVAQEAGVLAEAEEAFEALVEAWRHLPEFRAFLTAPGIPAAEKRAVLGKAFAEAPPVFLNFASLMIDKGRVASLPAVHEAFRSLRDRATGRVRVTATTAAPMTPEQVERVSASLKESLKQEVILESGLKPELLGGIRLQVGDWVADGTLERRLKEMSRRVAAAGLPEGVWG